LNLTPIAMLERLVAFPSVSRDSNLDIIHFIRDYLTSHGVASLLVPSPDGQPKANLYATIGPNVAGGVVLSGHTDVVPVDGQNWSSDPWTLTQKGDRLYGRGSCDMKGFDAIVLALVPEMLKADLKRPIHIAMSYDEETGCIGAGYMIEEMVKNGLAPLAVIVGEPTMMQVVTGHKGAARMETLVRGKPVHSSRMDIGVSAVMVAARLVSWHTDQLEANAAAADPANPFVPPYTTLHCGIMSGGTAANITAQHANIISEVRVVPPEDPEAYVERYQAYIRETIEPAMKAIAPETGVSVRITSSTPGLRPEVDGEAERLARRLTGDNGNHVVAYGTEGGLFQRVGWSTIVCGPGDIAQAHEPDEFIAISQMEAGTVFIRKVIAEMTR
jgi:acetylornithine deacetylase